MSTKKKIPLRQCVGCGEMKSKKEMIRVLKITEDTEEKAIIDATGRKNGRGAYLCPSNLCFDAAVKAKGLEKSLKMPIPKEVYDTLREEMEQLGL